MCLRKVYNAVKKGDVPAVTRLLKRGGLDARNVAANIGFGRDKHTCLTRAASQGDVAMISVLLRFGAHVDCRDGRGSTPLHWAAHGGSEAAATIMLDKGADVNAVDDEGDSALHFAADAGHASMVKELLERGANPSLRNKLGFTALDDAMYAGHDTAVAILREWTGQ